MNDKAFLWLCRIVFGIILLAGGSYLVAGVVLGVLQLLR